MIKKILHLFGKHQWRIAEVSYYNDASYGWIAPSTKVVSLCVLCGKVKVKYHYDAGYLPRSYFKDEC